MRLFLVGLLVLVLQPARQLDEAEKRALALDTLRKLGAIMVFDEALPGRPLVHLELSGLKVTDDVMPYLRTFYQLRTLYLTGTRVTDKGLENLQPLRDVQVLFLTYNRITDKGLVYLKGMSKLDTI